MLEQVKRIHLLGIGGIGVSAVARILIDRGYEVSGSDVRQSQLTEMIQARLDSSNSLSLISALLFIQSFGSER